MLEVIITLIVVAIISAIASGFVMSAAEYPTSTPNSLAIWSLVLATSLATPKPFSTTADPASASARAMPSPMPLVDPVTSEILPASSLAVDGALRVFS